MENANPIPGLQRGWFDISREERNSAHNVPSARLPNLGAHQLNGFTVGSSKQAGVYSIDNRTCRDPPATEEPAVQALDCFFASLYFFELDVNFSLAVGIQGNVNDMSILVLAFCFNVIFQIFNPGITSFSIGTQPLLATKRL